MTITSTTLTRAAGVAAAVAGLLFIGVQIGHPHLDADVATTTEYTVRETVENSHGRPVADRHHRHVPAPGDSRPACSACWGTSCSAPATSILMSIQIIGVFVLPFLAGSSPGLRQRRSRRGGRRHPDR